MAKPYKYKDEVLLNQNNPWQIDQIRTKIREPKPDRRRKTSPENGKKGGRPEVSYADAAKKFVEANLIDGQFKYKVHRQQWYLYNKSVYRPISRHDLESEVIRFLQIQEQENDKIKASVSALKNVIVNLSAVGMGAVSSDKDLPCWIEGKDTKDAKDWLVMRNGIVNIENLAKRFNGENIADVDIIRSHTPKLFSTFGVDYDYDPQATCPKWMEYIEGVQPDPDDREIVQMLFGLSLVPDISYAVFFILYGEGGTGKTVCLNVLEKVVGSPNVCCLPLTKFAERHSTHLLTEHLLNIVGDLPTSDGRTSLHHVEGLLKDVVSGGDVSVEHKHKDPSKAKATARNIFATNSLPKFADRSNAIWSRLRIIPFDQVFRDTENQNINLTHEIISNDLAGIFMWAVQGLAKLRKEKQFPYSKKGLELAREHRQSSDHEKEFLIDSCEPVNGSYIISSDLFKRYKTFCNNNGYRIKHAGDFKKDLSRIFPEAVHIKKRVSEGNLWIYQNIQNI